MMKELDWELVVSLLEPICDDLEPKDRLSLFVLIEELKELSRTDVLVPLSFNQARVLRVCLEIPKSLMEKGDLKLECGDWGEGDTSPWALGHLEAASETIDYCIEHYKEDRGRRREKEEGGT